MNWGHKDGIGYLRSGSGCPVVFLHAMAGSATAWKPQLETLGARFDCIAWDMPGFGDSVAMDETTPMPEVSDRLAGFLRGLGVEQAHFVGLSVGGMLLQTHAVRHANQVASLVILDSSPKFGADGGSDPATFTETILADLGPDASVAEFSDAMCRAITGPSCSDPALAEIIAAMSRAQRAGLRLTTRLIAGHDATDLLPRIQAPTLVLAGEEDTDTPPAYAEAIAKAVPQASCQIIPDAGHVSNLENRGAVTRVLLEFLSAQQVLS